MADAVADTASLGAGGDAAEGGGGGNKEVLLDEAGQPISKTEYKRRMKAAEKAAEKAAKEAAKAAAPVPEKKEKVASAVAAEEELDPSRCVRASVVCVCVGRRFVTTQTRRPGRLPARGAVCGCAASGCRCGMPRVPPDRKSVV